jgi:hypothetical protein
METDPVHVPPLPPGPQVVSVARKGSVVMVEMLCSDEYAAMGLYDRLCAAASADVSLQGPMA